jgi:hypothetical protein
MPLPVHLKAIRHDFAMCADQTPSHASQSGANLEVDFLLIPGNHASKFILPGGPMPKAPDDMSAAAVKKRAESSAKTLELGKAKATQPTPPPKPRMAKKR